MNIKSIRQAKKIAGKKILLRMDFNVPIQDGKVKNDFKIIQSLPTIRFLLRYKCKIILMSHLGKPKNSKDLNYSLAPAAERLSLVLDRRVEFIDDCVGLEAGSVVGRMKPGDIVMVENLRFHEGENKNSLKFARELSLLGDIYVNEAFAESHRKVASMAAIKNYLPAYAGLLLEKEINNLNKVLKPVKPLIVVMGGAKIETKLPLIKNLNHKSHRILIGGILVNNFLVAMGFEVGKSITDKKSIKIAKKIKNGKIILPVDVIVATKNKLNTRAVSVNKIGKNDLIYDIGPETIKLYSNFLDKANTIVWNGPMGMYEEEKFKFGTLSVARIIASRSRGKAFGVIGGGETVDALKITKMQDDIDWVSTGGGAMLTYLGGENMPGLTGIVKK